MSAKSFKETFYRRSTILDIRLYTGSSDFSFDNLDHIAIKNDILIQHSTPKARAGHSLNNVPNSSHLVLFGGYYLPNREIQSASSANPFVQRCDDDNFYAPNFEKVSSILVSACAFVRPFVRSKQNSS